MAKKAAGGNFHETFGDYENADKHYTAASEYDDIAIPTKILVIINDLAPYYIDFEPI